MIKNKMRVFNLFVPITGNCNQHCDFCEVPLFDFKHLSVDDFNAIFEKKLVEFNAERISVNIGGGEPLLHEDLLSIINYCYQRKINTKDIERITLFTNGERLGNKEYFEKFSNFLINNKINMYFVISTTIFSPETQQGIKNLFDCTYEPEHIYIKAVVSKNFISDIDKWYNNLIPIITSNHKKKFSIRFRFINFKFKAEINEDKYRTKYKDIMPALEKHISLLLEHNITVQTEFFPWCVWNNKELYFNHQYAPKLVYDLKEQNGIFIEKCNSCKMKESCNGFTRWTVPHESELIFS